MGVLAGLGVERVSFGFDPSESEEAVGDVQCQIDHVTCP